MAGEVYALSSDLVSYIATYPRPNSWRVGKEDQRMARWMRNHPNASSIHWISERCWVYDHPKAGTTYSRGFTFPDHVEEIRAEGRRGITEEERVRRGGEYWQSYSTVSKWRQLYHPPSPGLSIEEQVEALVEGGGRWNGQGWRSDNGRGPEAVHVDRLLFESTDARMVAPDIDGVSRAVRPTPGATGVKPGAPDIEANLPTARTTHFGKDLFRDPSGLQSVSYLRKRAANVQEGPTRVPLGEGEYEIHNLLHGPFEDGPSPDATSSRLAGNSSSSSARSAASAPASSSPGAATSAAAEEPYVNEPTSQIRIGQHAYAMPAYDERFLPAPSLRYDPATLSVREKRMLGRPHGGTVAVHYLKRNEWFFETALALIGRERMWDNGVDAPAYPDSPYTSNSLLEPYSKTPLAVSPVPPHPIEAMPRASDAGSSEDELEILPALWGGPRMYGSPIVLENGMIVDGRRAEANREVLVNHRVARPQAPKAPEQTVGEAVASRVNRITGGGRVPMVALAEVDGVEIHVGGGVDAPVAAAEPAGADSASAEKADSPRAESAAASAPAPSPSSAADFENRVPTPSPSTAASHSSSSNAPSAPSKLAATSATPPAPSSEDSPR